MDKREALEARRETLLDQMRATRSMKRGTLSIRTEKVHRKRQKEPALLGPYPLIVRRRLRSPQEASGSGAGARGHRCL